MKTSVSIVICGWYFNSIDLYKSIENEIIINADKAIDVYIASHKAKCEIDPLIIEYLEKSPYKLLFFENEGWEWGAYQQFLRWHDNQGAKSDYYLFLHDDIEIIKNGFVSKFINKFNSDIQLVGNSPSVNPERQMKTLYPEDVLLAKQHGFLINAEKWKVVRGSSFMTTKEVAHEILKKIPIKKGKRIELANSSLRIFAAMVAELHGTQSVEYLSSTPQQSEFIVEFFRGGIKKNKPLKQKIKAYLRKQRLLLRVVKGKKIAALTKDKGLKINLGCGKDPLPGYFNIDLDSKYADLEADIFSLDFPENYAAEIQMIHVIEHFNYNQVRPLTEKLFKWLKPGGHLVLEFPDVVKCCRLVLKNKANPSRLNESKYGLRGIFGGHKSAIGEEHKWGWTFRTIKPLLVEIGFNAVVKERPQYHVPKRDTRIVAIK